MNERTPTDCQGSWRPFDEYEDASVLKCDGCGEIAVITRGRMINYPPGWTVDAETIALARQEALRLRGTR